MNIEERKQILNMVASGKITVAEAEQLLTAIEANAPEAPASPLAAAVKSPKFLRVEVLSDGESREEAQTVNVRIPFQLLRSGIRIASFMPGGVQEKVAEALRSKGVNVDLGKLKPENLDAFIQHLGDMTIDVNSGNEKVRVFCE